MRQQCDAIGDPEREIAVVRDNKTGGSGVVTYLRNEFRYGGSGDRVELRSGFVVKDNLRLHDDGACNRDPFAHTSRKRSRKFFGGILDPQRFHRRFHALPNFGWAAEAVFAEK